MPAEKQSIKDQSGTHQPVAKKKFDGQSGRALASMQDPGERSPAGIVKARSKPRGAVLGTRGPADDSQADSKPASTDDGVETEKTTRPDPAGSGVARLAHGGEKPNRS